MPSWKGRSRGGPWGHRFFIFLINTLGIRFAYFFLIFVVIHFIPFAFTATRSSWFYFRNIHRFGRLKTIRMIYLNYYRFGQVIIDKIAIKSGLKEKYRYEFENYEDFLSVLNSRTGVILIGAHVGNWEAGSHFFGDYAKKINIVMFDAEYQKIKEILDKHAGQAAYKVIPISGNDFNHIFQIKQALDHQEYVCFQGDRFMSEKSTREINFMGRPARFPEGPFLLAAKYSVPVVFYYAMREPGMSYRFRFIIADTQPQAPTKLQAEALLSQYVNALEETLRKYPEQWFNYYLFWNE